MHVEYMGRREMHTRFWWGNLKERDHFNDLDRAGRIMLTCIFRAQTELIWPRIGKSGRLL
jgi:hypothetical protein